MRDGRPEESRERNAEAFVQQRRQQYRGTCPRCGAVRIDDQLGLEETPEEYIAAMVEVMREVKRVLRDDGVAFVNIGDSYAGSWGNYGAREGKQRTQNTERLDRPAWDEFTDRPPTSRKMEGIKPLDMVGIPWMLAFALRADGWFLRSEIIWHKKNPMPESVQGWRYVQTDDGLRLRKGSWRPTKAHEQVFLLAKSADYYCDGEAVREASADGTANDPRIGTERERDFQLAAASFGEGTSASRRIASTEFHTRAGRNRRDVWTLATHATPEAHFATFPPALVEPCILAGTSARGVCPACGAPWVRVVETQTNWEERKARGAVSGNREPYRGNFASGLGDVTSSVLTLGWLPSCACDAGEPVPATVLDPFVGSGTTVAVANQLGRAGIGIDLSSAYLDIAVRRIRPESGLQVEMSLS